MNAQENKELVRRYFEALVGKPKPPEVVDRYVAEQPLKDHIAMYEAAFPEYDMRIEQMIAENDLVSVIGRASGTHKGTFMGMPATGKTWDIPIYITYRVKDSRIVEHWPLVDTALFMQQLGMIPSPASPEVDPKSGWDRSGTLNGEGSGRNRNGPSLRN